MTAASTRLLDKTAELWISHPYGKMTFQKAYRQHNPYLTQTTISDRAAPCDHFALAGEKVT